MTRREAEFDRASVDQLIALQQLEADLGPHGIPMSVATSKDAVFVASEMPTHDKAAKAIAAMQDRYYKANPNAERRGDLWSVHQKT